MARATISLPVPLSPSIKHRDIAAAPLPRASRADGAHRLALAQQQARLGAGLQAQPQFVVLRHNGLEFQRLLHHTRKRCMSRGLGR